MADIIGLGEIKDMALWRGVAAEFIGSWLFIFSTLQLTQYSTSSTIGVGFSIAFMYAALNWILRAHNAGHLNPVISLSALAFRKISLIRWALYFCAQIVGSIVGAAFIRAMNDDIGVSMRLGSIDTMKPWSDSQAFCIEWLASFVLVLVYQEAFWNPLSRAGDLAPLAAGFAYYVGAMFAMPITMAAMNPARAFATAVIHDSWGGQWVGWVGPACGAITAIAVGFIFGTHKGAAPIAPRHDEEKGTKMSRVPPQ